MVLTSFGTVVRRTPGVLIPRLTRPVSTSSAVSAAPAPNSAKAQAKAQAKTEAKAVAGPRYPFSKNVSTRAESTRYPEQEHYRMKRERINKNILPISQQLVREQDPELERYKLFQNKGKDTIPIGSVLSVELWNNAMSKHSFSTVSGMLIRIHRKGTGTTITLRDYVEKTGVEQVIQLFSPTIKDIHVVKRALGRDSTKQERKELALTPFRYFRRSKLYMTRDDERWIKHVPNLVKADRMRRQQESQKQKGTASHPFQQRR